MGGGSIMRAVAKVAGIGVVNSGLRGAVSPESPISVAARSAARPTVAIAAKSSCDGVKASAATDEPFVEKLCRGHIDDREFAGGVEEIISGGRDPPPRLVFGGVPTLEEAKEATTELKDALEKVLVSSPRCSGYGSLHGAGNSSGLSQLSGSEVLENKACLTNVPSTANHAIQAFRFLNQNPEVQEFVASIASDPNVWNAVLQNPALQGYLQSCSKKIFLSIILPEPFGLTKEKIRAFRIPGSNYNILAGASYSNLYQESLAEGDIYYQESPRSFEVFSETGKSHDWRSNSKNKLMDIWQKIKLTVVDMASHLSGIFDSHFAGQDANKDTANNNPFAVLEKFLGPSAIGVIVMVVMVVVLKRF